MFEKKVKKEIKKDKTKDDVIKDLEIAEQEEGRTGLVEKFLKEKK